MIYLNSTHYANATNRASYTGNAFHSFQWDIQKPEIHHIQWMNYLNNQETGIVSIYGSWWFGFWVIGKNKKFTFHLLRFYNILFYLIWINATAFFLSLSLSSLLLGIVCLFIFFSIHWCIDWNHQTNWITRKNYHINEANQHNHNTLHRSQLMQTGTVSREQWIHLKCELITDNIYKFA